MSMLAPGPMASTVLAGLSSSSSSTTAVGSPAESKYMLKHCASDVQQCGAMCAIQNKHLQAIRVSPARRAWSLNDSSASSLSTAKHTLIAPADSCVPMDKLSANVLQAWHVQN